MDINTFKDDYIKLYETVLAEHEQVFQNQNLDELRETSKFSFITISF